MTPELTAAYDAWCIADERLQAALEELFGAAAGDHRYLVSTYAKYPDLAALSVELDTARRRYQALGGLPHTSNP